MAKGRDYSKEYARRKALKSVRASEAKRGGTYSKAYRERLIRNLEKGKTRQQARGHKPQEHIERREREVGQLGMTRDQLEIVKSWARFKYMAVKDQSQLSGEIVAWAQVVGWKRFQEYRHWWNRENREYIERGRTVRNPISWLESETQRLGVLDVSWLYYHN